MYKITYGSKENVSGDDSVIIENRSYEDTVIAYSSEIMQNWARIATEWLSDVLPTAFLLFITGFPFLLTIGFAFYYVSKKKIDYSCKKLNESEKEYHQG